MSCESVQGQIVHCACSASCPVVIIAVGRVIYTSCTGQLSALWNEPLFWIPLACLFLLCFGWAGLLGRPFLNIRDYTVKWFGDRKVLLIMLDTAAWIIGQGCLGMHKNLVRQVMAGAAAFSDASWVRLANLVVGTDSAWTCVPCLWTCLSESSRHKFSSVIVLSFLGSPHLGGYTTS